MIRFLVGLVAVILTIFSLWIISLPYKYLRNKIKDKRWYIETNNVISKTFEWIDMIITLVAFIGFTWMIGALIYTAGKAIIG